MGCGVYRWRRGAERRPPSAHFASRTAAPPGKGFRVWGLGFRVWGRHLIGADLDRAEISPQRKKSLSNAWRRTVNLRRPVRARCEGSIDIAIPEPEPYTLKFKSSSGIKGADGSGMFQIREREEQGKEGRRRVCGVCGGVPPLSAPTTPGQHDQ